MPGTPRPLRDGITIGIIAYASVALFYAAFDFLAARGMLYTVNLLGRAVFRGLRDPAVLHLPLAIDLPAVLLYNGLHLALSLAIGLVVMALVRRAEVRPAEAGWMFVLIVAGFALTIGAVGWLSAPIRPVLPWWSIVTANSLAVAVSAAYLVRQRPGIWRRVVPVPGQTGLRV